MKYVYGIYIKCIMLAACLAWGVQPASAIDLHGFADVAYSQDIHDADQDEDHGAFALGPLDFFIAEPIGPRLDVLAEFALELGIVDLERLQIGYLFSDAFKVYVGRFHSALGYWNTAYHHGAFLHTTIRRPFFLQFEDEGGVLPVHSVGLLTSGRLFLEVGELSYSATVANGSSIIVEDVANVLDPTNEVDPNKNKALGLHVSFAPSSFRGWALGLSYYASRVAGIGPLVAPAISPLLDVSQTILAADLTMVDGPWEFLAEYYRISDKDKLGGKTINTQLSYIQLGREFAELVTPYARVEQLSVDEDGADPYLVALGAADKRIETAGVRVRIGEQSVMKLEGRFVHDDGVDSHQEYGAQWAFTF